jgi:hypothetical protein
MANALKKKILEILNTKEKALLRRLDTPQKVQDFLDEVPFNFEESRETYFSPRKMLRTNRCHCLEGALFAHLCLKYHGFESFILDLKVKEKFRKKGEDSDHTVCLFRQGGLWGGVSKTNHSVLRWRDPIYLNPREIAASYFHEYFLNNGEKTLESYSKPFDVFKKFGHEWIVAENDLDHIAEALDKTPHLPFVPKKSVRFVRRAGKTEIKGASIAEWASKRSRAEPKKT